MTHVLAIETPDGAVTVFTSPVPWVAGTAAPTVNGRIRSTNYVEMGNRTVQFAEAPSFGDVVGFFLTLPVG